MKRRFCLISIVYFALLICPASSTDLSGEYNSGYNTGYDDHSPPNATSSSQYKAGWNDGQDDSDEDDQQEKLVRKQFDQPLSSNSLNSPYDQGDKNQEPE